ncbi:MAG TPA: TIGR02281 family clan AA aspartic protease [Hyphomonadaceae bacterium]|nr:TIGR02281 family clan AA aspartic protease [Hyphomonadaceae bacterium]
MNRTKFNPLPLLALVLAVPLAITIQNNSLRPAEAEPEIVKLPPQPAAPSQAEQYAAAAIASSRSVTLAMEDGHYWADARVNSAQVHFIVDTGASLITLTRDDARRIGVTIKPGGPVMGLSTANGRITAPIVTLKRVRIGNVEVTDVEAVVVEEGLDTSLLGMNFLNQLRTWQSTEAGLVLKQ